MAPVNLWSIVATEDSKRDLSYMKWVCQIFHFVNDDSHQKEKIFISLPSNRRKAVHTVRRQRYSRTTFSLNKQNALPKMGRGVGRIFLGGGGCKFSETAYLKQQERAL